MKKIIYTFLTAVIAAFMLMVSCADKTDNNLSQTGLIDQNGNIIKDTLIYTDTVRLTGNIPIWATNKKDYNIKTNVSLDGYSNYYEIKYPDEILAPNYPNNATDYYQIFVPYTGGGYYHTVSYKDTNKLKQLWFDQIKRKGKSDGKIFAIRNRDNNRDRNNFQNDHNGRKDYYYFKDNGDIVYKGGDKNIETNEYLIKRFVGAIIVDYRKITEKSHPEEGIFKKDKIENTGEWTVGAIYKMVINVNEARRLFKDGGASEGVYNFIGIRKWTYFNQYVSDRKMFTRQFYNTDFMEVLVLNPYANEGNADCLGVDAYYAYYGDYDNGEGAATINGFTTANYRYMTDENIYLAKRPEDIVPLLTHTTAFTDANIHWRFLAIPGHKY